MDTSGHDAADPAPLSPAVNGGPNNGADDTTRPPTPTDDHPTHALVADLTPRPLFDTDAFVGLTGAGATVLRESVVAPLVAAARGYRTAEPGDLKSLLDVYMLGTTNGRTGQAVKEALGFGGAMLMPWFTPADITVSARANRAAHERTVQLLPERPVLDATGRPKLYVVGLGQKTPFDVHPATPPAWIDASRTVLVVEGLLNGDAALTALLRHHGASDGDLRSSPTLAIRARLRALMDAIPDADRVLIISLDGVADWASSGEWNGLDLRGRVCWMAVDGDVSHDWPVWNRTDRLKKFLGDTKRGVPRLLDLTVAVESDTGTMLQPRSLSAHFATVGPWSTLAPRLRPELPPCPDKDTVYRPNEWRVDPVRCITEKYAVVMDEDGTKRPRWEQQTAISGRIVSVDERRKTTEDEDHSGIFDDSPRTRGGAESEASVEVAWIDPGTGARMESTVDGPGSILMDPPDQWHRRGARVPSDLALHPDWPPAKGWLFAVKAHEPDKVSMQFSWAQMGWVPVPGGTPVYIAGNQVIDADGFSEKATPGVTERFLDGAGRFGMNLPKDDAQALSDIRAVIDTYYHGGCWGDTRIGALVVAAGLRPAMPIRPASTVFFSGRRRSGKSFSAQAIMGFWQHRPGVWAKRLPGSAKDTMTSTELAVSMTNVWVVDDYAPSSSRNQATSELAKLGDLIRSVNNGAGKRRATASIDLQVTHNPKALLVITAENAHSVSSVLDRIIHVPIASLGTDEGVTAVERMRDVTGEPARVAGGLVRYMAGLIAADGCETWQNKLVNIYDYDTGLLGSSTGDGGEAKRHGKLAADLTLGLRMFAQYAAQYDPALQYVIADMAEDILSLVADHYYMQKQTTPGQAVLKAIRDMLASGQAHIVNPVTPTVPPYTGDAAATINNLLGWVAANEGASKPAGIAIGWLVYPEPNEPVIFLNPMAAFDAAEKHNPDLIPFGSKHQAAWSSAWEEGLCSPRWKRDKGRAGPRLAVRTKIEGATISGVPIELDTIINGTSESSYPTD